MGHARHPMDVDALAKGHCSWCGAYGHVMKDCRKKAVRKPKTAGRRELPSRKARVQAKVAKARRERRHSMNCQMDKRNNSPVRNQARTLRVCSWVLLTNVESVTDEKDTADVKNTTDVTGKPGSGSRDRLDNSGNPTKLETWVRIPLTLRWEERIDLTIDSGCAACALQVGVASAVGMQELDRVPQEYIAARSEKIWSLGSRLRHSKFQNGDVQNLKFSVMDKLHKPLVAGCKVVAARIRIVLQPENQGGSFVEGVRSKRRKRIFERNGVYVLPCWLCEAKAPKAFGTSG